MAIYALREDGFEFDTVEADSASEALDTCDPAATGSYDTSDGTVWTVIYAVDEEDSDGSDSRKFQIDPEEPDCSGGEHDWANPHAIVGGLKENPGVQGHGGGVTITCVCLHCGCKRVTDTWAQDPTDGEQGLESVSYEPGALEEEVAAMREEADDFMDGDGGDPRLHSSEG